MLILEDHQITFLKWLHNRLICLYGVSHNDKIISDLESIIDTVSHPIELAISDVYLDKIISKYYVDFNMDKSETWGFTEDERQKLRKQLVSLSTDIINKNVPKQATIKG
jgi:hypothetical protein